LATFVAVLNDRNFEKIVESRSCTEVWAVLFQNHSDVSETRWAFVGQETFKNASQLSAGMVHFGIIDVSRRAEIAQKHDVTSYPSIKVFSPEGAVRYSDSFTAQTIYKPATVVIPDFVFAADEPWRSDLLANPSVILFTNKKRVPVVWRTIAAHYHGKSIRIGATNNSDLFIRSRKAEIRTASGMDRSVLPNGSVPLTPLDS
jgi:hypothetical protein